MERLLELYDQGDTQAAGLLANWLEQLRNHKCIAAEEYTYLEREYRSREELKMLILESMRKADEETRHQAEAEGMAQGMAKGVAQRNREIAHAMTADNYPVSEIARLMNLSEDEVRGLLRDVDQR